MAGPGELVSISPTAHGWRCSASRGQEIGGNDAQAIDMGDATWIALDTPEWEAEYRARVDEAMTTMEDDGRWVYWMGMPVVRSDTFEPRVDLMNRIYEETAAGHPNVTFVPTASIFTGPDGEYLTNSEGDLVDMRLDDGVHFTTAGAILLADHLFPTIAADWNIPFGRR